MMISDRKIAKTTNLLELPIVEVTWVDSTSYHGWDKLEGSRKDTPAEINTVGRLIRHDRKFVSIAQSVNNSDEKVSANWVIPRSWVMKIAVIKRGRRSPKKRGR